MSEVEKVLGKLFSKDNNQDELAYILRDVEKLEAEADRLELLAQRDVTKSMRRVEAKLIRLETCMRNIEKLSTNLEITLLRCVAPRQGGGEPSKTSTDAVAEFWKSALEQGLN